MHRCAECCSAITIVIRARREPVSLPGMISDAALAIIVSGFIGISGVGASIFAVFKSTGAEDRRADKAARREAYGHFLSVQAEAFALVSAYRDDNCPPDPERRSEITQAVQRIFSAYGPVMINGGTRLGMLSLEVLKRIAMYDVASKPGMGSDVPDEPTMIAYNQAQIELIRGMQINLGMKLKNQPVSISSLTSDRDRQPPGGDQ